MDGKTKLIEIRFIKQWQEDDETDKNSTVEFFYFAW